MGIVFLAIEVSQNTNTMRIATVQSLQQSVADISAYSLESVEKAALFTKGINDYASLTQDEQAWLGLILRQIFLGIDTHYWAYRNGAMPDELWQRQVDLMRLWLNHPAGINVWGTLNVSEPFRLYVEDQVIE